jgi:hypothetical protein
MMPPGNQGTYQGIGLIFNILAPRLREQLFQTAAHPKFRESLLQATTQMFL